jgi:hypothetical protein
VAFDFAGWFHRRKVEAQFTAAPSRVQAVRVTNPYHAVGIKPCARPCPSALALKGRRFLSSEAPKLPLADCAAGACGCTYQHFNDRRSGVDRRRTAAHPANERRRSRGRRAEDHWEDAPRRKT